LLFPCSGAADVGEVADQAARAFTKQGLGRMSCLAGVGAGIPSFVEGAANAAHVVAIDGCPQSCASKSLTKAGVAPSVTVQLSSLGFAKGSAPANTENVARIVDAIRSALIGLPVGEPR
jgi:uncharacterized metal-binding protein